MPKSQYHVTQSNMRPLDAFPGEIERNKPSVAIIAHSTEQRHRHVEPRQREGGIGAGAAAGKDGFRSV